MQVMQRKKAMEQSGSTPAAHTRGSTPLNQTAPPITLPDLSKPPPAPKTNTCTGSAPANPTNMKDKKLPSLFDIKFGAKTKQRFPLVITKIVPVMPVPKTVPPTPHPNRFNEPLPPPPNFVTPSPLIKTPTVVNAPVTVNHQPNLLVATPKPGVPGHSTGNISARGGGRRILLPGQEPTRPVWSHRPGRNNAWWCRIPDCNTTNWYPSDTCSFCRHPRNSCLIRENINLKRRLEAAEREIKVMKKAKFEGSRERDINENTTPATNEDVMEVVPTPSTSNDQ
jgi:hypothetical protein